MLLQTFYSPSSTSFHEHIPWPNLPTLPSVVVTSLCFLSFKDDSSSYFQCVSFLSLSVGLSGAGGFRPGGKTATLHVKPEIPCFFESEMCWVPEHPQTWTEAESHCLNLSPVMCTQSVHLCISLSPPPLHTRACAHTHTHAPVCCFLLLLSILPWPSPFLLILNVPQNHVLHIQFPIYFSACLMSSSRIFVDMGCSDLLGMHGSPARLHSASWVSLLHGQPSSWLLLLRLSMWPLESLAPTKEEWNTGESVVGLKRQCLSYATAWIVPPPTPYSYDEALIPNVTVLEDVIKVKWGHTGGVLTW